MGNKGGFWWREREKGGTVWLSETNLGLEWPTSMQERLRDATGEPSTEKWPD